jgi:hypothetical protein
MTDANVENLVLEILRSLRSEVQTLRTEMHDEFGDLKQRMASVERTVNNSRNDAVEAQAYSYRQQSVIDRLTGRIERIEKRLELID